MRELHLDDLYLFTRVALCGTLSAVARERDVPVSQISRTLARIEKACGARLIHRSTHGLSLTAEGRSPAVAASGLASTDEWTWRGRRNWVVRLNVWLWSTTAGRAAISMGRRLPRVAGRCTYGSSTLGTKS